MNDKLIRQYIRDNGGDLDGYLLKDKGDGAGDFIAKWDMNIPEPKQQDLDDAQESLDSEKIKTQARRDIARSDKALSSLAEELYVILIDKEIIVIVSNPFGYDRKGCTQLNHEAYHLMGYREWEIPICVQDQEFRKA